MIYRPVGTLVFVYDGKGRAGYGVANSQFFAKRFNKGGFTRAHIAVKKKNSAIAGKV